MAGVPAAPLRSHAVHVSETWYPVKQVLERATGVDRGDFIRWPRFRPSWTEARRASGRRTAVRAVAMPAMSSGPGERLKRDRLSSMRR